jgi:hypothetical protein
MDIHYSLNKTVSESNKSISLFDIFINTKFSKSLINCNLNRNYDCKEYKIIKGL